MATTTVSVGTMKRYLDCVGRRMMKPLANYTLLRWLGGGDER